LTTSPHLVSITERIKINGREIGEEDFARHATFIREISDKLVKEKRLETVPTFFEQVTGVALSAFAEAKVELAILETGLGGRFDAMTAAQAEIVAITSIDFDHQKILGNSLAEIAAEKAAIIREGIKVVVAEQKKEALNVILEKCASMNVKPHFSDFRTELWAVNATKGRMVADFFGDEIYNDIELGLSGRHQITNARVAITLAETLRKDFGFNIENPDIEGGLEEARHKFLDEFVQKPITMIFGAMRDKDLTQITEILFPRADKLILTVPDNSRSMKISELSEFVPKDYDANKIYFAENVETALMTAKAVSSENDLICITGSLYLVGEAQKILKNQSEI
jgi:dihydrofolate synthase/folylpolyglutamate synthase